MTITVVTTSVSSVNADTLSTFLTARIVTILTSHISAKPRDNHAMPVAHLATTLPYANAARGPSTSATHPSGIIIIMVEATEVLEALGATNHPRGLATEDNIPAGPQAGSHTTTALPIASPTALPTVHLPISLTNLITNVPFSGTPRTARRSSQQTVLKPCFTLKVPC